MAKRSPILGYNHNVRYRGLIFHVQTEDSGLLQPHLFTHLFHSGVIVSTRKLVYDPGSDEGAIKSLMQAQHKAVMKDLRRGSFDDKIDQYLGGTPGLLPRGAVADESQPAEPMRESQPDLGATAPEHPSAPSIEIIAEASPLDQTQPTPEIEPAHEPIDTPQSTPVFVAPEPTTDDIALGHFVPGQRPDTQPEIQKSRTSTASRGSTASTIRSAGPPSTPPPPSADLDAPTSLDSGAVAAAITASANATIRTPAPQMMPSRTMTPARAAVVTPPTGIPVSEIMALELDDDKEPAREPSGRSRIPRDTDVVLPGIDLDPSDGIPGVVGAPPTTRQPADSVPPLPPPPSSSRPSVGASALPPSRPVTRPPARPAITPPQVVSRPITRDKDRPRSPDESDAIEVYAPAPPSADAPPGIPERERPGQYSQHKRVSTKIPAVEMPGRERSGAVPIPPGLGRPGNRVIQGQATPPAIPPRPTPSREPPPLPREIRPTPSQPMAIPQQMRSDPSSGAARPRTPTPSRPTPPAARTGSGSVPNSGVVMTRPAVIVGAPAKPQQPSRVRKAREDEGRGFGQGLISEKSLDEVILAYLSEDADDK